MSLLFCIKSLSVQGGGAERVLTDVANGLVARGGIVKVLTYDTLGDDCFYALDPRIEWIQLGIGSTAESATLFDTLTRMRALRCVIKKIKPEVVVGFMHSMFIPLGAALLGSGIPVVASEHIVPEHYRTRPIEHMLLYLTPFLVSRMTCVSRQVWDLYPKLIRSKMIPIVNPVTVKIDNRVEIYCAKHKCKIILAAGRLEEQKDHVILMRAFKLLADEFPDWNLRIVGEGSLRQMLATYAVGLGIADRIQMPGATRDISSEYSRAQIFVLPSRYESFGLTIAEALAHGLPAIGFDDCAGVNILIKSGTNGLLVSPGEDRAASLAEAIRALVENEELRKTLAQNATNSVTEYALDSVLDQWSRLFAEISGLLPGNRTAT